MIALVDYGAGNLRSVEFALDRLGVAHRRARTPGGLDGAAGIVLPGVGAAMSAMAELNRRGFPATLRSSGVPVLGICLGMQLLCEYSDEGGARTVGLGLVPGGVARFGWDAPGGGSGCPSDGPRLPVPHIGWARVRACRDEPLFEGIAEDAHFYFLHSYRAACPASAVSATAEYGEPFVAAIRKGSVFGVQFHPEKSGPVGHRLLANFCAACTVRAS